MENLTIRRKKLKQIQYKKPDNIINPKIETSFEFLVNTDIPKIKYQRSEYLHTAMVLLEDFLYEMSLSSNDKNKANMIKNKQERLIPLIGKLGEKLFNYSMSNRNSLKLKHRVLLFCVRTRLDLIYHNFTMYSTNDQKFGNYQTFKVMNKIGIFESDKCIIDYDLNTLWSTITRLISKFNTLYYHSELSYLVKCLYLCSCKFITIISDNLSLFNNILFRRKLPDSNNYCVNEQFIEETERVFFGLQFRLSIHESFKTISLVERLNVESKITLRKWLCEKILDNSSYMEFIEKDLGKLIYDWRVLIGEDERYKKEERFGEAKGYNIIAKYRAIEIDKTIEMLNSNDVIEKIMNRLLPTQMEIDKANNKKTVILEEGHNHYVDVDCSGVAIIVATYKFDGILQSDSRFSDQFVIFRNQLSFPISDKLMRSKFPVIIQTFNEFNVLYKERLYVCPDFASCFAMWVKIVCEDPDIDGMLSGENANLLDIYELLFPNSIEKIEYLKDKFKILPPMKPGLLLPNHYKKSIDKGEQNLLPF